MTDIEIIQKNLANGSYISKEKTLDGTFRRKNSSGKTISSTQLVKVIESN